MGPKKVYSVRQDWFRKTDIYGMLVSSWCKQKNEKEVLCTVCNKIIYCGTKGYAALTQHSSMSIHKQNSSIKLRNGQLLLQPRSVDVVRKVPIPETQIRSSVDVRKAPDLETQMHNVNTNEPKKALALFNSREDVTKAEIIWGLKSVQCNMAASACDDLKDIFSAMFPGSNAENFRLGRTKLSYLITEALGPYFRQQLLDNVRGCYFSLLFDETTNNADKKELQFKIRFWSEKDREVVCQHLQTVFLGHATAQDIVSQIEKILPKFGLTVNMMLMLGSDGPNVNKKVWRLINNQVVEGRGQGLINIGSCILHTVHNSFLKGLEQFGDVASELIIDLFYYFKKYPSRWEDFEKAQEKVNVKQHRFIKHVSSRWMTIGPAAERVLEQWAAIEEYFLKMNSAQDKQLRNTQKFQSIVKALRYVHTKVELGFVSDSADLYEPFLKLFQCQQPLIHVLDSEVSLLLKKLSGRICRPDVIIEKFINFEHLCKASETDCGKRATSSLEGLKENEKISVCRKIQRHFMASFNYLVKKNIQNENIFSHFQCLNREKIANPSSITHISELAKKLSFIGIAVCDVKDEWRILQTEVQTFEKEGRIDHFWRSIIYKETDSGRLKYPHLSKLIKASLSLSHGNSDAERGFSLSRRILAEDKSSMSERVLNDRLTIRDALIKFETVAQVPITKELLKLAYSARKSYEMHLEEQKKLKEQQKKLKEQLLKEEKEKDEQEKQQSLQQEKIMSLKGSVKKLEEKVKIASQEKKEAQVTADTLFKEANERLKLAIQEKNIESIRLAQGMMEGSMLLREKERNYESKEESLNRLMNKRKTNIIEAFSAKKCPKK